MQTKSAGGQRRPLWGVGLTPQIVISVLRKKHSMKRKGELVSKLKPQYQTKTLKQFHFLPLCPTDDEGSGSDVGKKFTKCSTCKYGAECDEDSEDVW